MPHPTLHVTKGFNEPAFYPMCPGSGALAKAIEAKSLSLPLLQALQIIGVDIVADGAVLEPISSGEGRGLVPFGDSGARLNNDTGE